VRRAWRNEEMRSICIAIRTGAGSFTLKQVGVRGECCVKCAWGGFESLELVFSNLKEARAEIEKLSKLPKQWLEDLLSPPKVVNA